MAGREASWSLSDAYARWNAFARDAWLAGNADPAAIERIQATRFDSLVRFAAANSRFHARRLGHLPQRPLTPSDVAPVSRHELMQAFDGAVTDPQVTRARALAFIADRARIGHPFLGRYSVWTSSGTSGEPGLFVEDPDALAVYDALGAMRSVSAWPPAAVGGSWRHFFSGTRVALIAATEGHFAGVATWQRLRITFPWIGVNAQVLPVTAPVDELCAMLERLDPAAIASYPTTLRVLAAEQLAGRVRLSPSVLWSGGEWCSAATRAAARRAFDCAILDDYGASEFMNIAHQCAGEALHVNADWVLLEPVDEKQRPVPPGTPSASVLLTNLANRVQPIIRYDLGDSVTFARERCACGSPFPAIRVEGRRDEILGLRDSRKRPVLLLPMGLATVIEEEALVHRFQVVQTAADRLEVRLEPARGRAAEAEEQRVKGVLTAYLARHGLPKAQVRVRRTPIKADAASGKFRQVWREDASKHWRNGA